MILLSAPSRKEVEKNTPHLDVKVEEFLFILNVHKLLVYFTFQASDKYRDILSLLFC